MAEPITHWGYHSILDCSGCDLELIRSKSNVGAFARAIVARIGMVAYGEPHVVRFGTGEAEGITLVQLIETSNICAHFADASRAAYIDVFSCRTFDHTVVEEVVRQFFAPTGIRSIHFTRLA